MSNLVSTPITDINGRQTTVHKKAGAPSKASDRASSVSKPTNAAQAATQPVVDHTDTLKDYRKILNDVGYAPINSHLLSEDILRNDAQSIAKYGHHYDSIWEGRNINVMGGRDGWSEKDIEANLDINSSIRELIKNEELDSTEFWNIDKDQKIKGIEICNNVEKILKEALVTKGRSLAINATAVIQRRSDFEGGGNAS